MPKGYIMVSYLEFPTDENLSNYAPKAMEAIKNATESLEVGGFRYKNKADAKKAAFLYYKTVAPALIKATYIAIKTIAIINEPANLVISVAVLSTPLPFKNF